MGETLREAHQSCSRMEQEKERLTRDFRDIKKNLRLQADRHRNRARARARILGSAYGCDSCSMVRSRHIEDRCANSCNREDQNSDEVALSPSIFASRNSPSACSLSLQRSNLAVRCSDVATSCCPIKRALVSMPRVGISFTGVI